jgi:ParB family chromosome partitioning protein
MPSRRSGRSAAANAFAHAENHIRVVEFAERSRPSAPRFMRLPLDTLEPNPDQPRREMSAEALEELAASIHRQGVLQPIRVREVQPGRYQIVAGHRRWRAAREAGLAEIPAVVADVNEEQAFVQALIENVVREDLSAVDRAYALRRLRDTFSLSSWEEVGQCIGIGRQHVHRLLNVTKLPPSIREDPLVSQLSEHHVRALTTLRHEPEEQLHLWRRILNEGLSGHASMDVARRAREARLSPRGDSPAERTGTKVSPRGDTQTTVRQVLASLQALATTASAADLAQVWPDLQALAVTVAQMLERSRPAIRSGPP